MNKWLRMTAVVALMPVLMMVSFITLAAAPPDLAGVWQGKLAVDAKTSLAIQFTFSKDAKGAYAAVLNSPDNPALKNAPATGVTWDGTALKLQVPSLQGSYAGTLKAGAISGQWTQPGGNLPLTLTPYQKPVVTKAAAAQINGAWMGEIARTPTTKVTTQFRFKTDDKGNVTGTFSIPDQGLIDSPVTDIEFADGKLTLRVPAGQQFAVRGHARQRPDHRSTEDCRPRDPARRHATESEAWRIRGARTRAEAHRRAVRGTRRQVAGKAGDHDSGWPEACAAPGGALRDQRQWPVRGLHRQPRPGRQGHCHQRSDPGGWQNSRSRSSSCAANTARTLAGKTLTGQWKQGPVDAPLTLTRQ